MTFDITPHASRPAAPSRRAFVKGAGASALAAAGGIGTLAAAAAPGAADPSSSRSADPSAAARQAGPADLITKAIPGTDERLPTVGLGMFMTFDVLPGAPRDHLRDVVQRFWDGGGRVFDVSPLYGNSEYVLGDILSELGIADDAFIANKIWTTGAYLSDRRDAERRLEQSLNNLWRERFDLMQVHSLTNAEMNVAILNSWKDDGRIRYVGVTHHVTHYFPAIEAWIRTGNVDVVQVRYSIFRRDAEERILPAAADHGVAVIAHMTLDKGRLHDVVGRRPVPRWAVRELDCQTWAQFYLKYVISHPAVTCALVGTRDPEHAADDVGAMTGPLPDESMRQEMVRHVERIPGFTDIDSMGWYPGQEFDGRVRLSGAEHVFN
ncbi:aldo/keto reductase [Phytoactinopolyspora halotolerans]|uniref:Aldo/keto reductase n=1 Tax=Phytoactinopolyspora halotolerans TaxID=1981512 RepID=A0A6L9S3Q9_9ACTN|nr:aldo/keto reductase [Phytoactinopolyspora halotolerans]NEE00075.1 aldo/keto reductase [Phytoactinopolyspora halotolerans]